MRSITSLRNRRTKQQQGFTLVELMVVIAIVGIVMAIAIPSYLSWKPGYIARGAVSQIRSDLNRAKMRALETRRQCRVVFSTNGYQIEDGNLARNSSQWGSISSSGVFANGTPYRTIDFRDFPGVTLSENLIPPIPTSPPPVIGEVRFSPRGTSIPDTIFINYTPKPADPTTTKTIANIAVNIVARMNVSWN